MNFLRKNRLNISNFNSKQNSHFYFINFIFALTISLFSIDTSTKGIIYFYNYCYDAKVENIRKSDGRFSAEIRDSLNRLGYTTIFIDNFSWLQEFDKLIIFSAWNPWFIPYIQKLTKEKIITFLWEPPTVLPNTYTSQYLQHFSKVMTFDQDLVDNKKFFKLNNSGSGPIKIISNTIPFEQKKLCVMMIANKDSKHKYSLYGHRRNVITFFENNHNQDFDLYGPGWQNMGLKNYKGQVEDKIECIKNYRFCFAYENMCNIKGYISEKIIDAFSAGCVPIYWGASNVTDYIPKECFIDARDFRTYEELYQFMKNMTKEQYQVYLDNIKKYFETPIALLFSPEYLIDQTLEAIEPGYDKTIGLNKKNQEYLAPLFEYLKTQKTQSN